MYQHAFSFNQDLVQFTIERDTHKYIYVDCASKCVSVCVLNGVTKLAAISGFSIENGASNEDTIVFYQCSMNTSSTGEHELCSDGHLLY